MNQVQSLKQSIEATLGKENVVIDIHQLSANDFYNITYYASNAAAEDWDLSVGVAWEPNYLDPSTLAGKQSIKFTIGLASKKAINSLAKAGLFSTGR